MKRPFSVLILWLIWGVDVFYIRINKEKVMAFEKGDIIWVDLVNRNPSRLKHPAVVWEDTDDESDFYGIMLTRAIPSKRFDNIPMNETHFETEYEITFSNTHFVNQLFIKFQEWGPFYKRGKLTEQGIKFIENELTHTEPMSFDEYI